MLPAFIADIQNKKRKEEEFECRIGCYIGPKNPIDDEDEDDIYDDEDDDTYDEDEDEDSENGSHVLNAKGGGGPPPAPDPEKEANARIREEEAKFAMQQRLAAQQKAEKEAEDARRRAATQTRAQQAFNDALGFGTRSLQTRGIDPSRFGIMDLYTAELNSARNRVPEISDDPASFMNGAQILDGIVNNVTNTQRSNLRNQLNEFADEGFESELFADTADDKYLDAIIAEQEAEAMNRLQTAYARGQLQDAGFNFARNELAKQRKAGRSRAEQTGLGVIQRYRDDLAGNAKRIRNRVDNLNLNDTFDINKARGSLMNRANAYKGSLEGDILAALGGESFFDTDTLLARGGERGGITNAGGNTNQPLFNLTNAFSDRNKQNSAELSKTANGVF